MFWKLICNFFKDESLPFDWVTIDSVSGKTIIIGDFGSRTEKSCFYEIQYSKSRNQYRMIESGYEPRLHHNRQIALKILSEYNKSSLVKTK
jgi:hypothetical protein